MDLRRALRLSRIDAYVGGVAALGMAAFTGSWLLRDAWPGAWGLFVMLLVGVLLEVSSTRLRGGGATGSIVFVIHLAALLLFGGFWAAALVGLSTIVAQAAARIPLNKIVFNTGQKVTSILVAASVYYFLGGAYPPSLLAAGAAPLFEHVVRDLAAFVIASLGYFAANSVLVSGAIAISTGRTVSEVWKTNTLWVLGYDVAASLLALLVAWLYVVFDRPAGLTRLGFLAVFLPVIAIKHVYGKLNTLQGLYDELDGAYEKLELTVREQLAMMVKSIEARDPYTSGHSRRVSAISRAIAVDFGLSEDLVEEVENAALLHDVGKIHAEFAPLLQKEGKLTPDEWDTMKTHAARSAELVGMFSRFRGHIQDSVRHHHERWDGLGYPDGIAGTAIPLGARIIIIADTIDAMMTDRPYRKALGFESVVAELSKHKATQFDAPLVDCTISSVSVRRIACQPDVFIDGSVLRPYHKSAPLRSYGSFFVGRRQV